MPAEATFIRHFLPNAMRSAVVAVGLEPRLLVGAEVLEQEVGIRSLPVHAGEEGIVELFELVVGFHSAVDEAVHHPAEGGIWHS